MIEESSFREKSFTTIFSYFAIATECILKYHIIKIFNNKTGTAFYDVYEYVGNYYRKNSYLTNKFDYQELFLL